MNDKKDKANENGENNEKDEGFKLASLLAVVKRLG